MRAIQCMLLLAIALALAPAAMAQQPCRNCGVIVSIQVSTQTEEWAPLGAIQTGPMQAGQNASSVSSSFVIGGRDSGSLVVIGAAGGAQSGSRPKSYQRQRWEVTVKMDDGSTRVLQQRYEPYVREGERVHVMGTQVELIEP